MCCESSTIGYLYGSGWELAEDQVAPPDILTAYGLMEAGDYLGPWVFNELHAALNLMHTRLLANPSVERTAWGVTGELYEPYQDREKAIADAYTEWSHQGVYSSGMPAANCMLSLSHMGSWSAGMYRSRCRYRYLAIPVGMTAQVRLLFNPLPYYEYNINTDDPNAFSNHGDAIPDPTGEYQLYYEGPLTRTDDLYCGSVAVDTMTALPANSTTSPPWPPDPIPGWGNSYGWRLSDHPLGVMTLPFEYADGLPGGGVES
jgi:hypothetical protein